jgi:hypothetical protein
VMIERHYLSACFTSSTVSGPYYSVAMLVASMIGISRVDLESRPDGCCDAERGENMASRPDGKVTVEVVEVEIRSGRSGG